MSNIYDWDTSAANNQQSPPDGWPEGQPPSTVNDAAREMMAATARLYQDQRGALTTTGAGNSYALTTNNGFAALADLTFLVFIADRANTGAATLNVDGLGAKSIRSSGSPVVSGQIVADVVYFVVYNATDDAFDLVGSNNDASNLTTGTLPDDRLSSNVPLKDETNEFTASFSAPDFAINAVAASPGYRLSETDADPDEKDWAVHMVNGTLLISSRTDAGVTGETLLSASRTGTNIDALDLSADTITLNSVDVSDYARLSEPNRFTSAGATRATAAISIDSSAPSLFWRESDAGADEKLSRTRLAGGTILYELVNDAESAANAWMSVTRSGNSPTAVNFPNGELQYEGVEVGYRDAPVSSGLERGKIDIVSAGFTLNSGESQGSIFGVYNETDSNITITEGSFVTLRLGGTTSTGNRTLAPRTLAAIWVRSSTEYIVVGQGVS